jgi:hypothetical protein
MGRILVNGEWWDSDEWEEYTRTHVFVHGQWWDRGEWEEVNRTNWWGLVAALLVSLALAAGAIALITITWDWLVEWVPVIVGSVLLLIIAIATVASAKR